MTTNEISTQIETDFPGAVISSDDQVELTPDKWAEIAPYLFSAPELLFDQLECLTGVDLGAGDHLEVRYNLHSMKHRHKLEIRISIDRDNPRLPSIEQVWRIGDWFEREAYDMFGIIFEGHRDLRRILCPEDWEGWPLRKDYETQPTYHGIVVEKVKEGWE